MKKLLLVVIASGISLSAQAKLHFEGKKGLAGNGKKIVLLSGDEEYRSEETNPMLAKILSQRFGFDCTVLFSMSKDGSYIDPNNQTSLPGIEELKDADLMIIGTRFRRLSTESYRILGDYLNAGKPVIAYRTATHAFRKEGKTDNLEWKNFGPEIVGEGWVSHHGKHMVQGARGVIEKDNAGHTVLRGVSDVFGPSDVYGVNAVTADNATILLRGQVTETLDPDSKPVVGDQNKPMQPLAWFRQYQSPDGKTTGTTFATTMGASVDFLNEDLRRLVVNAAHFLCGKRVPEKADVTPVDGFQPTFYRVIKQKGYYKNRNLQVSDFALGSTASTGLPDDNIPAVWKKVMMKDAPKGESKKGEPESQDSKSQSGTSLPLEGTKGKRLVFVGDGLGDGFQRHGHFEAIVQTALAGQRLVFRNLCHPGFLAGFRPHPSRKSQWAFPGAEKFRPEFKIHKGKGHYPTEDEWLTTLKADTVLGFFGFNESFDGKEGLSAFEGELKAWIDHTRGQQYNGKATPEIVLVSPVKPDEWIENYETRVSELQDYLAVMQKIASEKKVGYIDLFGITEKLKSPYGVTPGDEGYQLLGRELAKQLFGIESFDESKLALVHEGVMNKNWHWLNDYRMPNGVHVYGRRYKPFGPENYPPEIKKNREMTENRDQAIWALAEGKEFDLAAADAKTTELKSITSNYQPSEKNGSTTYLYGEDALAALEVADGFQVELFADERMFENLANPVQMAFDNRGRLWIATMPSYPHYRPGDSYANDKILIYEDTDGDGKADKETVFADKLDLPMGFELTEHGVYVSQAPNLLLMRDLDGDDRCDSREIVMTGFDHHDTHHAIGAFCADPSGAIVLGEGIFLHSNVETMGGPVRGVDGGFFRYNPRLKTMERTAQMFIHNPWGIAFDRWGQDFFLQTSDTRAQWMLPVSPKVTYGVQNAETVDLIPAAHKVRPTSGLEFVSSRHFPEEMQGDMMLCNTIGYLGIKQHQVIEDGTGYRLVHRQDLVSSKDGNFRPVDLEFAPDGSLYVVDWHNVLVGHMQHNARDPHRDHVHGRIYRITAKDKELVVPAKVSEAPIADLLVNLTLPEYRTRYRTRRELRGRDTEEVASAIRAWSAEQSDEHALLEALWVGWGIGKLDEELLKTLLQSKDHRVRSAAVRCLRYHSKEVSDAAELLLTAAGDPHGRVRLEASVAATWMDGESGLPAAEKAATFPLDKWTEKPVPVAITRIKGEPDAIDKRRKKLRAPNYLDEKAGERFLAGHEVYHRDGSCVTCHQADGKGLVASGFPPLNKTKWVNGDPEILIKMVLHGLYGPIEVKGVTYPGQVPMTPFGGMFNDEEIASVLTYIRNSYGNRSNAITPEKVKNVRDANKERKVFWTVEELLKN